MKTQLKSYAVLFLILGVCFSCETDDDSPMATIDENGIQLTNSVSNPYVLDAENPQDNAEEFSWNAVNFNAPVVVNYDLEASTTSTFDSLTTVATTKELSTSLSTQQMIEFVQNLGIDGNPETENPNEGTVYIRVRAYTGDTDGSNTLEEFSEPMELDVEVVETDPTLPMIYVVGDFLNPGQYGENWTPANAVAIAAESGNTNYEGFVNFNNSDAQYKFLPTNENFDGDYGDSGSENGAYSGTLLQENEVNCGLPNDGEAGYYFVNANPEELTYSMTKTEWAIIGSATPSGWDSDTDLTYDASSKTWTITLNLTAEEIKFRANDAWDINLGVGEEENELNFGGDNIAVSQAGNYTITLDLSNPRNYTYSLTPAD